MSTQLQLRRDTSANIAAITPAQGEPVYDVSRKALVLGDGATAGGLCATPFSGTWTPQLQFGGANVGMTTSSVVGGWTQVGNLVFFNCIVTLTAKGSSTGAATIAGLPSSSIANAAGFAAVGYWANFATSPAFACGVANGGNYILLGKSGGTTFGTLADTDFTNASVVEIFGFYFAAQPTG